MMFNWFGIDCDKTSCLSFTHIIAGFNSIYDLILKE